MKRVGAIAIGLAACGLALVAGARADAVASADNPYTPIVTRNIFGLNAAQATDSTSSNPPVKITLNGIMSVFGRAQALFKIAGADKPGQPKDRSYILSEGQREDDIEVTHIDDQANLVTFNNHGVIQEIPLANTPVISASGPGPAGGPGSRPAFGRPVHGPGSRSGETGIGNRFGAGGAENGANNAGNGSALPSTPANPHIYNPSAGQSAMSPEERAALSLINTEQLEGQGDPRAKIMPTVPTRPQYR